MRRGEERRGEERGEERRGEERRGEETMIQWGDRGLSGHPSDSQRQSDDMRLNILLLARLGRGPENATESNIVFA
ncbi:hypothetical protein D4764_08G0001930 [Takifugu flavidus]|uniref:Uncharacterized protein n=1 Tax=Takifugu flavidus TaxID=433684 RepID=A0A5C6MM27_9TELE|nr:hypothetical protein D4764_08G0001930 [Takifugu flavidus]